MKDTIISAKRKRTEIRWIIACFIIAIVLNIISIIIYDTSWKEMATMIHILLLLTVILYVIILLVRLIIQLIVKLTVRK